MECKMVAIMFNVDHPFSLYSFICLCCFFSFFPPLLLTEPSRMQEGAAKNETAGGEMKKKCDLSQWIRRRGRMCNHEAAMKAAAAFISGELFFQLSLGARFKSGYRERERETAEGLSSF